MGIPSKPVGQVIELRLTDAAIGDRLDKALAAAARDVPGLSRSRLAHLIAAGHVTNAAGRTLSDAKVKVKSAETYRLDLPPPAPAEPLPEAIPLSILHEDLDLIVLDKPAGMVVHPAPGAETGTLVNALLAHCGPGLTGIGGVGRPGIVHRIDKDTSGLLVVAKTQAAHAGLSALFAAHDIERVYQAVLWGAPDRGDPRLGGLEAVRFEPGTIVIDAPLDRHPTDRKRMAVTAPGKGRRAVTRLTVETRFGPAARPFASLATFRLETGRTHQIRVHAAHIGHALVGDPVYGRARQVSAKDADQATRDALASFPRQALHAATLGFRHPTTGETLNFDAPLPPDLCTLVAQLRRNGA